MTYSLVEMSVLLSCFFKFDSLRIMFGKHLCFNIETDATYFDLSYHLFLEFISRPISWQINMDDICFIYHLFYRLFLLVIDISRLGFCDLELLFPILFPYPPLLIFPIPRSLPCVLFTIHNSLFSLFWTRDSLFFILYSSFSVL